MATIVVLNGPSSAGKTTLARAVQEMAGSLLLNFSIDAILYSLPESALARIRAGTPVPDLRLAGLHDAYFACVKQLADLGHDLIVDNAITAERQAQRLREAVEGHQVLTVLVTCSPETLAERERARGDRRIGLAASQCDSIERWLQHDLRIDTSVDSPEAAARKIMSSLSSR